jgi:hypothetical protein
MTRSSILLAVALALMIPRLGLDTASAEPATGSGSDGPAAALEKDELSMQPEVVDENTVFDKDAGDTLRLRIADPKSSQLLADATGKSLNLLVTSWSGTENYFVSLSSSSLTIPHPFSLQVLNLSIATTTGSPVSVPASDGLRSCLQMVQLLQLQSDEFYLDVRVDLAANSVATLASDWLTVRFNDVGDGGFYGSFRCELVRYPPAP